MSRQLFASYYIRRGYHIDENGNLIMDKDEYSVKPQEGDEKKNLPARRDFKDPEISTETEESLQLKDPKYQNINFVKAPSGLSVHASELENGGLYLTDSAQLFSYENGKMVFYTSVIDGRKLKSLTELDRSLLKVPSIGGGEPVPHLLTILNNGPSSVGGIVNRLSDSEKVAPVISYFLQPVEFSRNQFVVARRLDKDEFPDGFVAENELDGRLYITKNNLVSYDPETRGLSGVVWPVEPTLEELKPATQVSEVVPILSYLESRA